MVSTDPSAIAWAAGLFEGEGSIAIKNNGLTVTSTDRDVIEKFWKIVGCGWVYSKWPNANELGKKKQWIWATHKTAETLAVLRAFLPWLGERRTERVCDLFEWMARERKSGAGEENGNSKLTLEQVLEIRAANESATALAKRYGVTMQNIRSIQIGETWKKAYVNQ